ncbi:MAG: tetratricopeptide repeat protein [Candidatus Obscuribacterales bacterium]|nr:tetratricopeptide repeat protein [Candidatus Obscuribacterales bacterium]
MSQRNIVAISCGIAILLTALSPVALMAQQQQDVPAKDKAVQSQSTDGGAEADAEGEVEDKTDKADNDEDLQEVSDIIEKSDRFTAQGQLDAATNLLRDALKTQGQNPHLRERLSRTLYLQGSLDEAISQLQLAITVDPNEFNYYAEMAWLYSISGDYRDAIKYSRLAIQLDPAKGYPYVVLGFSLGCLGKRQPAMEALRKAIGFDPTNATAYTYLADVMSSGGDYKGAMPLYEKAVNLDSKAASAWLGLGVCSQKFGKKADALKAYQRAVDLSPRDATARGHLGFALSHSGDIVGGLRQGMIANSIRLSQSWGKFMGMFVAVWAGIFLLFGAMLGAIFMGSRFAPMPGESIVNQFVLVFYRDRPGRLVITDMRLVFIPELISRWFGATRFIIYKDQVLAITKETTSDSGTLIVVSSSATSHTFKMPAMVLQPAVDLFTNNGWPIGSRAFEMSQEMSLPEIDNSMLNEVLSGRSASAEQPSSPGASTGELHSFAATDDSASSIDESAKATNEPTEDEVLELIPESGMTAEEEASSEIAASFDFREAESSKGIDSSSASAV